MAERYTNIHVLHLQIDYRRRYYPCCIPVAKVGEDRSPSTFQPLHRPSRADFSPSLASSESSSPFFFFCKRNTQLYDYDSATDAPALPLSLRVSSLPHLYFSAALRTAAVIFQSACPQASFTPLTGPRHFGLPALMQPKKKN